MFDNTWKIRQDLCKVYKIYRKKESEFLYSDSYTYKEDMQLQDIQYAIVYALCRYFDFNYDFYYHYCPFSYKWYIAYDYIFYYDECFRAYYKFVKENNTHYNNVVWSVDDFNIDDFKGIKEGDIIMKNGYLYYYDGKNFINMC